MGWMFTHRPRGISDRQYFTEQFFGSGCGTILECATVRGVFYAAVRPAARPDTVYALVCLTRRVPKDRYNFGYKDMDETMGPYCYDAPAHVLDALTPTEYPSAIEWREHCRRVQAVKQRIRAGETLRVAGPGVRFKGGLVAKEFTAIKIGRRRDCYLTETGALVRYPNLAYAVLEDRPS